MLGEKKKKTHTNWFLVPILGLGRMDQWAEAISEMLRSRQKTLDKRRNPKSSSK